MTEKAPAFQFYPRDFIGNFDVSAMTLEEIGFYTVLLCHAWLEGGLPNDHGKIARALHISSARFDKLWSVVGLKFEVWEDGTLRNGRQERERQQQEDHRRERSLSGQKGNAKRHNSDRSATAQRPLSDETDLAKSRSSSASASADVHTAVAEHAEPAEGDAERAYQQWREAWERSGRTALHAFPKNRDQQHLVNWVTRYPDADWRARQLEQFFQTQNLEIRKSPPTLGWFLTWVDEIDKALRDAGYKPKVAA